MSARKRCAEGEFFVYDNSGWRCSDEAPVSAYSPPVPGEKPSNPKQLIGSTKPPLHLFPRIALVQGSLAFLEGALKYGRSNYRAIGVKASIYYDAAERHLNAWFEGETIDSQSGLPHLAKALACIALLIDAEAAGVLEDDRAYPGGFAEAAAAAEPHVKRLQEEFADKSPKHYTIADGKDSK